MIVWLNACLGAGGPRFKSLRLPTFSRIEVDKILITVLAHQAVKIGTNHPAVWRAGGETRVCITVTQPHSEEHFVAVI